MKSAQAQRGGFGMGLIVGLVIGLALALGVALYVTKAPVPFVNKVPQRSAEQDNAEAQRNKNWDPNAPLASKVPRPVPAPAEGAASGPSAGASPGAAPASAPAAARNPAAILAGQAPAPAASAAAPAPANTQAGKAAPGADPFTYFVQAMWPSTIVEKYASAWSCMQAHGLAYFSHTFIGRGANTQ